MSFSPVLLSDDRVARIAVVESADPLVRLHHGIAPTGVAVRTELAKRLYAADLRLPAGIRLRVVEGYRTPSAQQAIIDMYTDEVRTARPDATAGEVRRLTSRFVAPMDVAPHVAGAAVDLTLVDLDGSELDLGTAIDDTPEASGGRCYFGSAQISREAQRLRAVLAEALEGSGLVNYPTEWWHWSYGDRYWALMTGASWAIYGPVDALASAECVR